MTRPGRLGIQAETKRDQVEEALFALCSTLDLLDEISLRIRQAMVRTAIVEVVLGPAIDRLERVRKSIVNIRQILSELWEERQADAWDDQRATNQ